MNETNATEVLIELVRRFDAGEYERALELWAYDPLVKDRITLDELKAHVDARITRGRTVADVKGVSEAPGDPPGDLRVTIAITYRDGESATGHLMLRRVGDAWRVTSRGSLI